MAKVKKNKLSKVKSNDDLANHVSEFDDAMVKMTSNKKPTIEQILSLENLLLECEQIDLPIKHYFAPSMYVREMFIPAGTVLTGAVHKVEHITVFDGDITVFTGEGMVRITGHQTFTTKPGIKRVGYAHEDTYCTGYFVTDTTDIKILEKELVEDSHLLQGNRLKSDNKLIGMEI